MVRSLGVSQLIIAVNKLDTIDWSKQRFDEIVVKLGKFLKTQVGFKDSDVSYVPVSGLTGANLNDRNINATGITRLGHIDGYLCTGGPIFFFNYKIPYKLL